jgi:hypothetical protein
MKWRNPDAGYPLSAPGRARGSCGPIYWRVPEAPLLTALPSPRGTRGVLRVFSGPSPGPVVRRPTRIWSYEGSESYVR